MDRVVRPSGRTKIKDLLILSEEEEEEDDDMMEPVVSVVNSGMLSSAASANSLTYRIVTTAPNSNQQAAAAEVTSVSASPMQAVLASPINGQFYVIGNPSDVLGSVTTRSLAPRVTSAGSTTFTLENLTSSMGQPKDERRRATHNEVERRRRDNINTWIMKLSKLIPFDLASSSSSPGSEGGPSKSSSRSKGDILARACEYVAELRNTNQRLLEKVDHRDQVVMENERLQQQVAALKSENILLRQTLESSGIALPAGIGRSSNGDGQSILG